MNWYIADVIRAGGPLPPGLREGGTCFVRKVANPKATRAVIVMVGGVSPTDVRFLTQASARRHLNLGPRMPDDVCEGLNEKFGKYMQAWRKRQKGDQDETGREG